MIEVSRLSKRFATPVLRDVSLRVPTGCLYGLVGPGASGKSVLIVAHGNSLRALVKYLENISDEKIISLDIPTARPLVYELDDNLKPLRPHYYLGNSADIEAAKKSVANQGKASA